MSSNTTKSDAYNCPRKLSLALPALRSLVSTSAGWPPSTRVRSTVALVQQGRIGHEKLGYGIWNMDSCGFFLASQNNCWILSCTGSPYSWENPQNLGGRVLYRISGRIFPAVVKRYQPQPCQVSKKPNLGRCSANEKFEKSFWNHIYIYIYKYLENIVYHCFRQLWLVLWVKLMEINSNLFSGYTQMTEVFNFF